MTLSVILCRTELMFHIQQNKITGSYNIILLSLQIILFLWNLFKNLKIKYLFQSYVGHLLLRIFLIIFCDKNIIILCVTI